MLETNHEPRFRRFLGLFWPSFNFFFGNSIRKLIQPPKKEVEKRLKRTRKSTKVEFVVSLLDKKVLLAYSSILLLTTGFADNSQSKIFPNEETPITINNENQIAGWFWGKNALKSPKTLAAVSSEMNLPVVAAAETKKDQPQISSSTKSEYRSLIEFKAGYFFFTDHKMRKVYDQGGLDLQLCGSTPIWRWLQIYGGVEYLERHGRSINGHQKTSIWEVPISLGLKAVAKITRKFQYYFTLGPRYIFVHVHNRSHFVDKNLNENGFGGFANTGFHYFPSPHIVIDIFGEYSYARMHFHAHKKNVEGESRQVGGLVFGGGIGYAF